MVRRHSREEDPVLDLRDSSWRELDVFQVGENGCEIENRFGRERGNDSREHDIQEPATIDCAVIWDCSSFTSSTSLCISLWKSGDYGEE